MKSTLVDPLAHPVSGAAVLAVVRGRPVYPILGADGDDDGDDGADDDADDDDADEDGDDDDSDDDAKSKSKSKSTKRKPPSPEDYDALEAKAKALEKRMKAADKNRSDAQKKLDELERQDKTELQNAKADLEKVTKERDTLKASFTNMALTNAFLTASAQEKIQWVDPEDAQAVGKGRFKDLEINEDGSVEGIREIVKKLAKDKPHLVQKAKADDDEEDEDDSKNRKDGASGSRVGAKTKVKKGEKGKLSDDELKRRFPALR